MIDCSIREYLDLASTDQWKYSAAGKESVTAAAYISTSELYTKTVHFFKTVDIFANVVDLFAKIFDLLFKRVDLPNPFVQAW